MAAGRIVNPRYFPARDRNGRLVSGALMAVRENLSSSVLASVYSDEALTTPLTNPVAANSSGQFPDVWCDAGTADDPVLYTLAFSGPNGESIGNPAVFDNWQPSLDAETAQVALAEAAADAAEAYYQDILELEGEADPSVAIATRAAKAANGSDFADPAAVRTNIGADLASNVNFTPAGTGAVVRTVQAKARESVSILDFIPVAHHAGIAAGTYTADLTSYWNLAKATRKPVYFPDGGYCLNITLTNSGDTVLGAKMPTFNASFEFDGGVMLRPFNPALPVIEFKPDPGGVHLNDCRVENVGIVGVTPAGVAKSVDGILFSGTSENRPVVNPVLRNIIVKTCLTGLRATGNVLTATLENVTAFGCVDGIDLDPQGADTYINGWVCTNVHLLNCDRDGLVTNFGTGTPLSTAMLWNGFKSEFHGQDITQPTSHGVKLRGTEAWTFINLYMEGNGGSLTSGEGYGLETTGINRGLVIEGGVNLSHKYPFIFSGTILSGRCDNIAQCTGLGAPPEILFDAFYFSGGPKFYVDPCIPGERVVVTDANGQSAYGGAVDFLPVPGTTLDLSYQKDATLNTGPGSITNTGITGLVQGDEFFLFNQAGGTANTYTIPAVAMLSGAASVISANTGKKYKVLGVPNEGKLVEL